MKALPAICVALALAGLDPAAAARAGTSETMDYDITWVGVSVGTLSIRSQTSEDGILRRTLRVWNRPWIALVYPVDNTIACRIEATAEGPRHTVTKKMGEKNFRQNDTLVLWPAAGRAVWSNAISNVVHSFAIPKGARDYVSFFFDLRDVARGGKLKASDNYQLVMDNEVHALEIRTGTPELIRTPQGRIEAIPVKAISKSPPLFSRNKPRAVWVAASKPVVIFTDVETRFGAVRATLVEWTMDGAPVSLNSAPL